MNRGQLNGFALNGASGDPIVRVRVDARGYARVSASGRVLAYAVVQSAPAAGLGGKLGRVDAHLSAKAIARAAVAGAIGRLNIQGLLATTGRVVVQVKLPPIYGRVNSLARAAVALQAHALARGFTVGSAQARLAASPRIVRRAPVTSRPAATINAGGVVYARRLLRSPTESRAQAFVVSSGRIAARLAVLTQARSSVLARAHVKARAPVIGRGIAFIDVDFAVNKQLPFDEPAPEYRTFYVPAGQHTFVVSE